MNRVGIEGHGESVWLGWFLCAVLASFSEVMEKRNPGQEFAAKWRAQVSTLANSIDQSSWDGEWYLRGFFDNSAPLGSRVNQEARIDSLPQSWAIISQVAPADRARQAMASAERYLVDERNHVVRLFTPPFDHSSPNPGHIMGYPPGLRENGGQYTHGSLWMAMARARMGDGNSAVHLLRMMNPVELTRSPDDVARYRGEPYVVAADVSSAEGKTGRSGWTWYTGSAGWMYRIWIEEVLGFQLRGDTLTLKPVIPDDWPGFEMTYHYRSSTYEIVVSRHAATGPMTLEVDGRLVDDGFVHLADDGLTHHVTMRIPRRSTPVVNGEPIRPPRRLETGSSNGMAPSNGNVTKIPLTSGD